MYVAFIIASALALPHNGNFAAWEAEYGKTHDPVESEANALKAYIQNDHIIEEHNANISFSTTKQRDVHADRSNDSQHTSTPPHEGTP